ncbi:hypothetical protein G6F57_015004 [Rhizopus arrhizus]|nr:hypothetical protein G6F57_015004 [Rhizopus arrhizus]
MARLLADQRQHQQAQVTTAEHPRLAVAARHRRIGGTGSGRGSAAHFDISVNECANDISIYRSRQSSIRPQAAPFWATAGRAHRKRGAPCRAPRRYCGREQGARPITRDPRWAHCQRRSRGGCDMLSPVQNRSPHRTYRGSRIALQPSSAAVTLRPAHGRSGPQATARAAAKARRRAITGPCKPLADTGRLHPYACVAK